jgi:hypothetical protein
MGCRCRVVVILIALIALAGCQTRSSSQITTLNKPVGQARIVLMPPDVELTELTTAGLQEPRADWTSAARQYLTDALKTERQAGGALFTDYDESKVDPEHLAEVSQFSKLHGAVGTTILVHRSVVPLPTKQGKFDWTLGEAVQGLRKDYDADYAMFIFVRDSYTSAGRVALIAAAAVLGVGLRGGTQLGFASLVDLNTGNVVWFNQLARGSGDMRTPDTARETARALLKGMPQ